MTAPSALALLALLACARGSGEPRGTDGPPNIVLAIADDMDPDHLGFCGNPLARTPHLDELAKQGAYFRTLYVQPVCRSALATLLTGRWPHETGMTGNLVKTPLAPEAGDLPALLKQRGYATYCGGKFWEGNLPGFGFDAPAENDEKFAREGEGVEDCFRFLDAHASTGPWFVWWAPSLPHTPHRPPARFNKAFADTPIEVPASYKGDPNAYVEAERASLAMESWLDAEFGRLVEKLRDLGELESTLIVFLADNGWSTATWAKGTPMEKGVRSPLVVKPPGSKEGRELPTLVDLVDVHATVLDYAGADSPSGCRGRSLRPLLEGKPYEPRTRLCGAVYGRYASVTPYALYVRDERWKYVFFLQDVSSKELSPGARLAPEFRARACQQRLFDLEQDPLEQHNLAGGPKQVERVRVLHHAAFDWWSESGGAELQIPVGLPR